MKLDPQFVQRSQKRCSVGRLHWVPRFSLRRMRNRFSATRATLDRVLVVATAMAARALGWPDAAYKEITFTTPDVLWPLFGDNPH